MKKETYPVKIVEVFLRKLCDKFLSDLNHALNLPLQLIQGRRGRSKSKKEGEGKNEDDSRLHCEKGTVSVSKRGEGRGGITLLEGGGLLKRKKEGCLKKFRRTSKGRFVDPYHL